MAGKSLNGLGALKRSNQFLRQSVRTVKSTHQMSKDGAGEISLVHGQI